LCVCVCVRVPVSVCLHVCVRESASESFRKELFRDQTQKQICLERFQK